MLLVLAPWRCLRFVVSTGLAGIHEKTYPCFSIFFWFWRLMFDACTTCWSNWFLRSITFLAKKNIASHLDHWLRVPERIRSKVVVLVYKVLHGCAPSYLGPFTYVADLPSRQGLLSSCSDCLVQPPVLRSITVRTLCIVDLSVLYILRPL